MPIFILSLISLSLLTPVISQAPIILPRIIDNGILTAYSADKEQTDNSPKIMASGKEVYEGAIACPRKYPFGTLIKVNGIYFICEDRKNIRYENYKNEWFDIFINSKTEAQQFGIWRNQRIMVY